MRISVNLTVEIDEDDWASEYGIPVSDVRADVRNYIAQAVREGLVIAPKSVTLRG